MLSTDSQMVNCHLHKYYDNTSDCMNNHFLNLLAKSLKKVVLSKDNFL